MIDKFMAAERPYIEFTGFHILQFYSVDQIAEAHIDRVINESVLSLISCQFLLCCSTYHISNKRNI